MSSQDKIPPWLRERTPEEIERERRHLAALEAAERRAVETGAQVRPKVPEQAEP